jgi:transposase InsO family protein
LNRAYPMGRKTSWPFEGESDRGAKLLVSRLNRISAPHRRTRVELANAIFEYLEVFHNRQRRHSALQMLTPIEFEQRQIRTVA